MQIENVTQPVGDNVARPSSQVTSDVFLTLLVAQLRSQNPLEPVSPNEFVSQLVQFNTLEQIIGIRQALENPGGKAAPTPATELANQQ